MTREEFIISCWNYYLYLEEDFIKLTRYISIHSNNYKAFSDEIHKQLLSVAMEFENINKEISKELGNELDERCNIIGFGKWLFNSTINYKDIIIEIKFSKENLILNPFKKEEFEEKDGKKTEQMPWWRAYNKIKHNRYESYFDVNFEHLLNALAALLYCEMYLVREIGRKTKDMDVPNSYSEIFEVKDWQTKHKLVKKGDSYATNEEIEELLEDCKKKYFLNKC